MLKKLYTLVAVVLIISVLMSVWIAYSVTSDFNRKTNEDILYATINLFARDLVAGKTYQEADQAIKEVLNAEQAGIRMTVVDFEGNVLFDNETDYKEMDNHFYRPEVYQAYRDQSIGHAIRKSDTQNIEIYYLAEYRKDLQRILRASVPMVVFTESVKTIGIQFVFVFGGVLIALLLIGIFAIRLVSRPLLKLEKAAVKMSQGEYDARVKEINGDSMDIARLAMAFNKMADQLQTVISDLEEKNIQMDTILNSAGNPILAVDQHLSVTFINQIAREEFLDPSFPENGVFPFISVIRSNETETLVRQALSDKQKAFSQIGINTRKGQKHFAVMVSPVITRKGKGAIVTFQDVTQMNQLQQIRTDFVANVTHELRTPLTSIRGFVDTLRNGSIRNPQVSERFLDIIDVEAERLHKLINDILTLSEIEEKKEDPDIREFDLNSLVDEVVVLLDDEATSKNVSLITSTTGEEGEISLLPVKADPERIKQILINLIENAIKYNIDNGKVYVRASRNSDNEVEIVVKDTGNGISKEHLPRVFERFYRVDKSRSKQLGGTGLGLSIVKHIAMLYNGNAKAESEIGQGSIFTVTLKI